MKRDWLDDTIPSSKHESTSDAGSVAQHVQQFLTQCEQSRAEAQQMLAQNKALVKDSGFSRKTHAIARMHRISTSRSLQSETVEQISIEVERIRLDFIMSQIETAHILARSAQTCYLSGSTEHAERVQSKAWQAYQGAVDLLSDFSVERKLRDHLTGKLSQVRAILNSASPSPLSEGLLSPAEE